MSTEGGGGFIPLSPPASTTSTTTTTSHLPKQRSHPLRPGSSKESTLINYIDNTLLSINRRHAKKFSSRYDPSSEDPGEKGYESFKEVVRDVEGLIDLVWVSGTPTLQIPYLISLAVLLNTCLSSYPFSPKSTFRVLRKMDWVFASLLTGQDVETGEPLVGFEDGRKDLVSVTEKVRIKSVAEEGRVRVVEVREGSGGDSSDDEDGEGEGEGDSEEEEQVGTWEMETARVYERTIQLLGDELGRLAGFGEMQVDVSRC